MNKSELAVVVLAAGLSSRMRSENSKVLCEIKGKPMILRSVELAVDIADTNTIVVIGYQANLVKKIISKFFDVKFAYQENQLGTGDAAFCSVPLISDKVKNVVIMCGDLPLLKLDSVKSLIEVHFRKCNDISLLAAKVPDPKGYGRIFLSLDGQIEKIVEEIDASKDERRNNLINAGVFCVNTMHLGKMLNEVKKKSVKKEIYLTDIVEVGRNYGLKIGMHVLPDFVESIGVNTLEELNRAENLCNTRTI